MKLTELAVRQLKPKERQVTYFDDLLPGFGIRIGKKRKSWVCLVGPKRQRVTLGHYPAVGLQEARANAREMLATPADHGTPQSFVDAAEQFLRLHHGQKNRSKTIYEKDRVFRTIFISAWSGRKLKEITSHSINTILDSLTDKPGARYYAYVTISTFFRWAVRRDLIDKNPCAHVIPPPTPKPRERLLTDTEVAQIRDWAIKGCQLHDRFSAIVLFLLLSGQRRHQAALLKPEWIDHKNSTITWPSQVMKNKRSHTIPIAINMISPRDFNLVTTLPQHLHAFSWMSRHVKTMKDDIGIHDFTLHDFRRYFSSTMARLGVPLHVTEKLLSHQPKQITGVAAVYNRYDYMVEMREAVDRYTNHVLGLK